MRITIRKADGYVEVDGVGLSGIDTSSMDVDMAYWVDHPTAPIKGTEVRLSNGAFSNEGLETFDKYQPIVDAYHAAIASQTVTPEPTQPSVADQIDTLERAQLLPRVTREFMLLQFQAIAAQQGIDPMTNIAYAKLKAFDDQITALRAQL
jgi:hypothetical protein